MKRLDRASILGLTVGTAAIVVGNAIEGGTLSALVQPAALLIVLGGTLGATLLSTPLPAFLAAMRGAQEVFSEVSDDDDALIDTICELAQKARRDGLLAIEAAAERLNEPFLKKALRLAVDGADAPAMRRDLERALDRIDEEGHAAVRVWEAAGGFAPTIGIIGAVIGLIHVMQNLSDVSLVGRGIATAFVATVYGVGLANLLFLPIAEKLRARHERTLTRLTLLLEGAIGIQEGHKGAILREKLAHLPAEETTADVAQPAVARRFTLLK